MSVLRAWLRERRYRKKKAEIIARAEEMDAVGLIPESWWR